MGQSIEKSRGFFSVRLVEQSTRGGRSVKRYAVTASSAVNEVVSFLSTDWRSKLSQKRNVLKR